jgi:hypothetical protein
MENITEEMKTYSDAFNAHVEARKQEVYCRSNVQRTRCALLKASEMLRLKQQDVLEDELRLHETYPKTA